MRWSGRRSSQQQLRREWVPPDITHRTRPLGVISHYPDSSYVIGNSTPQGLKRIARLFKFGYDEECIQPDSPAELPTERNATSKGSEEFYANFQPSVAELSSAYEDIAELP